ncbi:hypothetical protein HanRHA438_Chr13g0626271 [Helianthus annuus]|nr:hypothetical protein HanRHA438_Chr13g0626271 [Helianthus annuus]
MSRAIIHNQENFSSNHFFLSSWRTYSSNNTPVIQARLLARYSQFRLFKFTFLKHLGLAYFPIIHKGSFSEPSSLQQIATVSLSFSCFFPSSCIVARE